MSRKLLVLSIVLVLVAGAALSGYFFIIRTSAVPQPGKSMDSAAGIQDHAKVADAIARKLDDISPTESYQDQGWIAKTISFVAGQKKAYVEYTDTHIALRLLLEYDYQDAQLETKVLATFIPDESGAWQLQYGQDAEPSVLENWVFDGDARLWVPQANDAKDNASSTVKII